MVMLNCDKYLDQQTCHLLRSFVVAKYSRFLWSVTMLIGEAGLTFEVVLPNFESFEDCSDSRLQKMKKEVWDTLVTEMTKKSKMVLTSL